MKRIFRFVVSFLLICVILVNCSPIRAEATGVEALYLSTVFVNPTIAVTAVLFGLGVMVTAAATAVFTKLVDDITVDMVDKGLISSSGVDMYRSDADGAATYLVNRELVESVREYLFEEEIVWSETSNVPADKVSYNGWTYADVNTAWIDKATYPYAFIEHAWKQTGNVYLYMCSAKPYVSGSTLKVDGKWQFVKWNIAKSSWTGATSSGSSVSSSLYDHNYVWFSSDILKTDGTWYFSYVPPIYGGSIVKVQEGLIAGEIASQDKSFTEGYSTWASGALSLPTLRDGVQTDAESAYIALGMGLTQEETMAMTQAAVQSGVGTYENTGTTADTITASGLKGWLDTLRLSMVAGFSDVITGIKDFFTPSGNVEAYALDLKLLFPFCIPFDLFNLLKVLQADPVAPHFEFELDFGSLGKFPVSVDFSEWNDLASLLRTLEMGLFIVGLAVGTRKLMGD